MAKKNKVVRLTDDELEAIKAALEAHLEKWGGSRRELSKALGVSATTINKTFRGDHVKKSSYESAFEFFGDSLDDVLAGAGAGANRGSASSSTPANKKKASKPSRPTGSSRGKRKSPSRTKRPLPQSGQSASPEPTPPEAAPPEAAPPVAAPPSLMPSKYTRDVVFARVHGELERYERSALSGLGVTDALLAHFLPDGSGPGEAECAELASAFGTTLAKIDALIATDNLGVDAYGYMRGRLLGFMDDYGMSLGDMREIAGLSLTETTRVFLLDLPEPALYERAFESMLTSIKEVLAEPGAPAIPRSHATTPAPPVALTPAPVAPVAPAPRVAPGELEATREQRVRVLKTRAKRGGELRVRMESLGLTVEALAATGGMRARHVEEVMLGVATDPQSYDDVGMLLGRAERDATVSSRRAATSPDASLAEISVGTRDMLDEIARREGVSIDELLKELAFERLASVKRGHDMYLTRAPGDLLRAPAGTQLELLDRATGQWLPFTKS